ncbi:MAG TPA: LCP family protein [Sedimentibacter sp.]|nr:LCP family protein [Sedimentibacter sp.]HQO95649.1 LCP family protein [Sedimentibacter sp.]
MKQHFIKVFLISLIIFSTVITTGIFTYAKFMSPEGITQKLPEDEEPIAVDEEDENLTPLEKAMRDSNRINALLIGFEGARSDTIMLGSFDRKTKEANIISIPRDTYYKRDAYAKYSEMQKINAVYGSEDDGYKALLKAVEEITGISVDKYVAVNYNGVRAAVDAIGGVEVNVPIHMKYTDIYDKPPLYIDIKPGPQIIYGDKAMELLRFRTGDPGYPSFPNGDVGRVEMQQQFIKSAIKKSLSLRLPNVISAVYPHVETNFTLTELLGLAKDAIGFSTDNLTTQILPGNPKILGSNPPLSFYIPDGQEITKVVYDLYDVPLSASAEEENVAHASE